MGTMIVDMPDITVTVTVRERHVELLKKLAEHEWREGQLDQQASAVFEKAMNMQTRTPRTGKGRALRAA
jgi:hypothetical protein